MKITGQRDSRGFTLLEIVIAMSILALVSGTVMAILVQAGDAAADIRDTDQKDEEISRFLDLLEKTVETLPVDASIEMVPESESISGFPEMKISNAVGAFIFGEDIGSAGELIIGLQAQAENNEDGSFFELAISRDSFSPEDTDNSGMVFGASGDDILTADSEGRYWLPLVSNILSASWRYWDEEGQDWLTEWEEDNLPPLMEFVVEDSHRPGPVRVVFEIPEHLVTGEGVSPDSATQTSGNTDDTTSSTSSVSRPTRRPGGDRPGGGKGDGVGRGPGKGPGGKGGKGGRPGDGRPGGGDRPGGGRPGGGNPPQSSGGGKR